MSTDPSLKNITAIAVSLGMKENAFTKCLDSNETAAQVKAETNEGATLFGVNGTPGNVVINTKTGKYVVLNGAYPLENFQQAVAQVTAN